MPIRRRPFWPAPAPSICATNTSGTTMAAWPASMPMGIARGGSVRPAVSPLPALPAQQQGIRKSGPLPYELHAACALPRAAAGPARVEVHFQNDGLAGAVFHVYDHLHLDRIPQRFTIEAGKRLRGLWEIDAGAAYDLWVLGPNGFHRHFTGVVGEGRSRPEVAVAYDKMAASLRIALRNDGTAPCRFKLAANAYAEVAPAFFD